MTAKTGFNLFIDEHGNGTRITGNASGPQKRYWFAVPLLLMLASATFLGYGNTMAEPDLTRMMTALVYGKATGLGVSAGYHYGISFSFGYYHLLYALAPSGSLLDPDQSARLLNDVGLAFACLLVFSGCLLFEKLLGSIAAAAASIGFFGCPMMLPFTISGHPQVAAYALLFFAAWLLLVAQDRPRRMHSLMLALLAMLVIEAGLSFRAEIALAFPFIAVASYFNAGTVFRRQVIWFFSVCAMLAAAYLIFLVLQRPYVETSGGASGTLHSYINIAHSIGRIGRGAVILALSMGLFTLLALLALVISRRFSRPVVPSLLLIAATLALPTLIFWLPVAQPARHFMLAIFAFNLLLASLVRTYLVSIPRAILLGTACILANQLCAELVYPLVVESYQWSYKMPVSRRATQQLPLGFFPLDQKANQAAEAIKREEAIEFAAGNPQQLIFLADTDSQNYLIAHLIVKDPSLRLQETSLGGFDAVHLGNQSRSIYFVSKYKYWPKDVLAEILNNPNLGTWKIKEQSLTKSRFDKTALPRDREFGFTTIE